MTHPITKTDNYILITSDEEIKEGDYHVATRIVETNGDNAIAYTDKSQLKAISEIGGAKKIVAYLPLNNLPILKGVPLLPPLPMTFPTIECIGDNIWEELTGGQEVSVNRGDWSFGFGIGYNKAKEKYKFTEEDVIKIVEKSRETGLTAEYLMLSFSQPKLPVGFKCEMQITPSYKDKFGNIRTEKTYPKIINGVMQGEWIFE